MTYTQKEIEDIKARFNRADKHIKDNIDKIPLYDLKALIDKQQRRANMIAKLMMAEIKQWEELASGNYTSLIKSEIKSKTIDKRLATAKAEGRSMTEVWVFDRVVGE